MTLFTTITLFKTGSFCLSINPDNLCLVRIKFQFVHPHPALYQLQALGQNINRTLRIRWKRNIELAIICILGKLQPKPPEELAWRWLHIAIK